MNKPKHGDTADCQQCGKMIAFVGDHWEHVGGVFEHVPSPLTISREQAVLSRLRSVEKAAMRYKNSNSMMYPGLSALCLAVLDCIDYLESNHD